MFPNSSANKFVPFAADWQNAKVVNSLQLFADVCVASVQLWFLGSIVEDIVRSLREIDDPIVQSSHQKSFEIVIVAVIVSLFVILFYMVLVNKVNF
jgi:hypothetical protein